MRPLPRVTPFARRAIPAALALGIGGALLVAPAVAGVGDTTRLSVSSSGVEGPNGGGTPTVSDDGRYVGFASFSPNLVAGDGNMETDIFRRDRVTGQTVRVNLGPGGVEANSFSNSPELSGGGRHIAYASEATNLVGGDGNGLRDVFLTDIDTGATTRASVNSAEAEADDDSYDPSVSSDGRFVAFESPATNLVGGDGNGVYDIFVRDTLAGTTERVSVATGGVESSTDSRNPAISGNGRFVAFTTVEPLSPADTNNDSDVYVHDRSTGVTTHASVGVGGASGDQDSHATSISADGRRVAFWSRSTNLVPGDTNNEKDIFVRDLVAGTTLRVDTASGGAQGNGSSENPAISPDGRFVAFYSYATNLVPGDTNADRDVFVKDTLTNDTSRVSVTSSGGEANMGSTRPALSDDARIVAFESDATNLVAGDTNNQADTFAHEFRDPPPPGAPSGPPAGAPASASGATPSQAASSRQLRCRGKLATHVGTPGNDVIRGTKKADVIVALGGRDRIIARGGNDTICAGSGRDTVLAGAGRDIVLGQGGRDLIKGQGGRDLLLGNRGPDRIFGNAARDTIKGGPGNDRLFGQAGRDRLYGNGGRDFLIGGRARDLGVGGKGKDRYRSVEIRRA